MDTKRCTKCKAAKPVAEFYRHAAASDGLQARCKPCSDAGSLASIAKIAPPPDGKRPCTSCKEVKPMEDFPRNKNRGDGRHYQCKACMLAKVNRWRATNRERHNTNHRESVRKRTQRKFGLPDNWSYDDALAAQGGGCAICESKTVRSRPGVTRFNLDHDHATGAFRGLLCTCCNQAIGQMNDRPDLLRKAADYIEQRSTPHPSADGGAAPA